MKIRTQLILAFFVLAILPLTGIVLYSYWSSLDAVRAAVEEDGRALTEEMDERLASVRRDLDLRFASLAQVPFSALLANGDMENAEPLADRLVSVMGDAAPWIESLEYIPAPPAPPAPAEAVTGTKPVPGVAPSATVAVTQPTPPVARVPGVAVLEGRGDDGDAVVIDVPRMLAEISLHVTGDDAEAARLAESGAALGLAFEMLGEMATELQAEEERLEAEIDRAELFMEDEGLTDAQREQIERSIEASTRARSHRPSASTSPSRAPSRRVRSS
jgi:hypothetical protein